MVKMINTDNLIWSLKMTGGLISVILCLIGIAFLSIKEKELNKKELEKRYQIINSLNFIAGAVTMLLCVLISKLLFGI